MQEYQPTTGQRISDAVGSSILLIVLFGAVFLAYRNFHLGRGDRRGAFKLAVFAFSLVMLSWLFSAGHEPAFKEVENFLLMGVAQAMVLAGIVWLVYIALEPYARRRWSVTLIAWSRLLGGGLRDPLVGRDLLVGVLFGVSLGLLYVLRSFLSIKLGKPILGGPSVLDAFLGTRWFIVQGLLWNLLAAILLALFLFFLFLLLRVLTRREWLAAVIFVLGGVIVSGLPFNNLMVATCYAGLSSLLTVIVLLRFGLLAVVVNNFVWGLFLISITTDFSSWHSSVSLSIAFVILVLAIYGFHTSLGGQKVFAGKLLKE